MWLWQRKNTQNRHLLWLKLFSLCLFVHLSYLSWAFFIAHDGSRTISVSLHKHLDYSAPILFIPITAPTNSSVAVTQTDNQQTLPTTSAPIKSDIKADTIKNPAQKATTTVATPVKPAEIKKPAPTELPKAVPEVPVEQAVKKTEKAEPPVKQEPATSAPATQAAQNQRVIPEN